MYSYRPGGPGAPEPGAWGIRAAARRAFTGPARLAADDHHTARLGVYLTDMLAPYRLNLAEDAFTGERGHSYGEMAEPVVREAVGPHERVDLLILAYAIPDIAPGRATAAYLSHVCPGQPLAFAICDQGNAAAFSGLRLLRAYARSGACRRGLLVVVEQAELPYAPATPVEIPAGHTAVALLCGDVADEPGRLRVDAIGGDSGSGSAPGSGSGPVLGEVDPAATLIAGSSLAGAASAHAGPARIAAPGRPYTGVWWELAGLLASPDGTPERVVLADHDPGLGYLSTATLARVPALSTAR
jgi:hypothetical protein